MQPTKESSPTHRQPAVKVMDFANMQEALYFRTFEKVNSRSAESELCVVINAPHALALKQSARSMTFFIDQEPIPRDLLDGQFQILPVSSEYPLSHPDWIRKVLDLLDLSLIGRGSLQLGLADLKEVLAVTDSKQLYFAVLSAEKLIEEPPLQFRSLYARLLCSPGCSYRSYLEVGLSLTAKLPKGAPLRFGLVHDNLSLTNLMLLGALAIT